MGVLDDCSNRDRDPGVDSQLERHQSDRYVSEAKMNEAIEQLLENGRAKLREAQAAEEKRKADEIAEREASVKAQNEATLEAIYAKLPEHLWGFVICQNERFSPFLAKAILMIDGFLPITLRVKTYPEYTIEGLWIIVPGLQYVHPSFFDDFYEGAILMPTEVSDRLYGLDAWPYETADLEKALAIAEQRMGQFLELDRARLEEVKKLKQQMDDDQRKRDQLAAQEIEEFAQPKEGQIEPLAAMESWVRSICADELAQRGL